MAAHRYWRILARTCVPGGFASFAVAELIMRSVSGGSNLCTGGSGFVSSTYSGQPVANAFDGNAGTYWVSNNFDNAGEYIGYDFGASTTVDIIEFALTTRNDYAFQAPATSYLQWSDNGSTWFNAGFFTDASWTAGATHTHTLPPKSGAHRFWGLIAENATSSVVAIGEIAFRTAIGGAGVYGGTATAGSIYSTAVASNAFSGSTTDSLTWVSNTGYPVEWIVYDYGAGNNKSIVELALTSRDDGSGLSQSPNTVDVICSDNGTDYIVTDHFTGMNFVSYNQDQILTLASVTVNARIIATQLGAEVFIVGTPAIQATQLGIEVFVDHAAGYGTRVSDLIRQTLYAANGIMEVSDVIRQVLRSSEIVGIVTGVSASGIVGSIIPFRNVHRYWRISFPTVGFMPIFYEIEFRESVGGSPTEPVSSSAFPIWNGPAALVFDGNPATSIRLDTGAAHWIEADFGANTYLDVVEVAITGDASYSFSTVDVQYSDDEVIWTTKVSFSGLSASSAQQIFSFPAYIPPPDADHHRYWRTSFPTVGFMPVFYEIEFRESVGGSPTEPVRPVGFPIYSGTVASVFDGNPATSIQMDTGTAHWIEADFGVNTYLDVVEVAVTGHASFNFAAVDVQYSDDDVTWTTKASFSGLSASAAQQIFSFSPDGNGIVTGISANGVVGNVTETIIYGHRYWRLNIYTNAAGNYASITLLEMATTIGGTNLCVTGASCIASSSQSGHEAQYIISGANYWGAASGLPAWGGYDFGTPVDIAQVRITPFASLIYPYFPLTFTVDYSDNGTTWTEAHSFTAGAWGAGTQTFELPTLPVPDPYFSNVVFLCHADGPGINDFIDTSNSAHAYNASSGATISPAAPQFGAGSIQFSGGYVRFPASNDWNFGAGPFTIEAWGKDASGANYRCIASTRVAGNLSWEFHFNDSNQLEFWASSDSTTLIPLNITSTPPLNVWHHLAVDRDASNVVRLYVDGVMVASMTMAFTIHDSSGPLYLGNDDGFNQGWSGWLDEIRITKGVARYAGAFTRPTAPFASEASTDATTNGIVTGISANGIVGIISSSIISSPAGTTTPSIIQSAFSGGYLSPITITLTTTPTVGNTLLFIVAGFSTPLTPPSGFITFESDATSNSYQGSWVYYKVVQIGDPLSYDFTDVNNWHRVALFELDNFYAAGSYSPHGAMSGGFSNSISATLTAANEHTLRLFIAEWDNTALITSTPTGWILLSPTTWLEGSPGNHDAALWLIPSNQSGTQTISLSSGAYWPIWLDLQIASDTVNQGSVSANSITGTVIAIVDTETFTNVSIGEVGIETPAFFWVQAITFIGSALPPFDGSGTAIGVSADGIANDLTVELGLGPVFIIAPTPLTLDGIATGASYSPGSTPQNFVITDNIDRSHGTKLTTTQPNDIICIFTYGQFSTQNSWVTLPSPVVSVVGAGLTFQRRAISNSSLMGDFELWWAIAPNPLTGEAFTVTWSNYFDGAFAYVFAVSGCNISSPWDSNSSLPAILSSNAPSWTPSFSGISTAGANDFLIFALTSPDWQWDHFIETSCPGISPDGFIPIIDFNNTNDWAGWDWAGLVGVHYRNGELSNATITLGSSVPNNMGDTNGSAGEAIFDALYAPLPESFNLAIEATTELGLIWEGQITTVEATGQVGNVWPAINPFDGIGIATGVHANGNIGNFAIALDIIKQTILVSPTLDGIANGQASSTNSVQVTLTTTQSNDIVCILTYSENPPTQVNSVIGGGLTFQRRAMSHGSSLGNHELWWAIASLPLSATMFTVTYASNFDDAATLAFAVSGCNISSPWDSNSSLPMIQSSNVDWVPTFSGISTSNTSNFVIFAVASNSSWGIPGTSPTNFVPIGSVANGGASLWAYLAAHYEIISTTLTNATITFGSSVTGGTNGGEAIFDALGGSPSGGLDVIGRGQIGTFSLSGVAHRYWRLALISNTSNAFSMAEVQFRNVIGTPCLFSGGTASAAQTYQTFVASNATDNDLATEWSGNDNTAGQWWQYDYGVGGGLNTREISITSCNSASYFGQTPSSFSLQFSDNGSTWITVQTFSTIWTAPNQTQIFDVFDRTALVVSQFVANTWASGSPNLIVSQFAANAWATGIPNLVVTQNGVEITYLGNPNIFATQIGVEITYSLTPALVATQTGVEITYLGNPEIAITQFGMEVSYSIVPNLVVTQLGYEVGYVGIPDIVITQLGYEVAYSIIPSLVNTKIGMEVAYVLNDSTVLVDGVILEAITTDDETSIGIESAVIEIIDTEDATTNTDAIIREIISTDDAMASINGLIRELIDQSDANIEVASTFIEVLRSGSALPTTIVIDEILREIIAVAESRGLINSLVREFLNTVPAKAKMTAYIREIMDTQEANANISGSIREVVLDVDDSSIWIATLSRENLRSSSSEPTEIITDTLARETMALSISNMHMSGLVREVLIEARKEIMLNVIVNL